MPSAYYSRPLSSGGGDTARSEFRPGKRFVVTKEKTSALGQRVSHRGSTSMCWSAMSVLVLALTACVAPGPGVNRTTESPKRSAAADPVAPRIEPLSAGTNQAQALARLEGFATDPDGPKAGLLVQLILNSETKYDTSTDDTGFFELLVPPGDYLLNVVDLPAMRRGEMVMRTQGVILEPGDQQQVELPFGGGVSVSGTVSGLVGPGPFLVFVRRPGGTAPEDVPIDDQDEQIESAKYLAGTAIIQPDGTYEVVDLEPGTYILEVPVIPARVEDLDLETMDRTPYYRAQIVVGEEDSVHDIAISR